jgi:DNA-binding winged helix-turn-helix (wHTH) protein
VGELVIRGWPNHSRVTGGFGASWAIAPRALRTTCTIALRLKMRATHAELTAPNRRHMQYSFGGFRVSAERRELTRMGAVVRLSPKALDLLLHLITHRNRVVPKDELEATLWQDSKATDGTLATVVARVRRALGDFDHHRGLVRTISRLGYRFSAPDDFLVDQQANELSQAVRGLPGPTLAVLPFASRSHDGSTSTIDWLVTARFIDALRQVSLIPIKGLTDTCCVAVEYSSMRAQENAMRKVLASMYADWVVGGLVMPSDDLIEIQLTVLHREAPSRSKRWFGARLGELAGGAGLALASDLARYWPESFEVDDIATFYEELYQRGRGAMLSGELRLARLFLRSACAGPCYPPELALDYAYVLCRLGAIQAPHQCQRLLDAARQAADEDLAVRVKLMVATLSRTRQQRIPDINIDTIPVMHNQARRPAQSRHAWPWPRARHCAMPTDQVGSRIA